MNRHFITVGFVCSCFFLAAAPGLATAQTEGQAAYRNNEEAAAELEKPRNADFFETRLGDVLDGLHEQSSVRFRIHESAIDSGLDEESPITISLRETRLATLLTLITEEFGCTYLVEDGIVQLVSNDFASENPMVAVIDCRELLDTISPRKVTRIAIGVPGGTLRVVTAADEATPFDEKSAPQPEADSTLSGEKATASSSPDAEKNPAAGNPQQPATFEYIESPEMRLIALIEESVDPESWERNGGYGRIEELSGRLVIAQSAENLRTIRELLEQLR